MNLMHLIDNAIERTKQLLEGYSVKNVHSALLYSAIYVAIRDKGLDIRLLQPLEDKIPKPLVYHARRTLVPPLTKTLNILDQKLESKKPVTVDDASVNKLARKVKNVFGNIDYVMVYDCMSLIEFLVVAASMRLNNLESTMPDIVFVNPIGLTRYVTHQLTNLGYRAVLREFAHLLASELGSRGYSKSAYIDLKVHEYGSFGVEEYINRIDIIRVVEEVLDKASNSVVLVTADHGYDVVYDVDDNYLYVTHGFREPTKGHHIPLLLFSRFSFFLKALPER